MLSVAEAIARVPAWAGKETRATPLSGGITNQNYRVDVEGESFVLRICGDATDLLGVNRAAEYDASRAAGQLGIAPQVFYRNISNSKLLIYFLNSLSSLCLSTSSNSILRK